MKTRTKFLLGWLGLELAALPLAIPAAALMKDRISFEIPQKIIAVPMPSEAGQAVFLVASNGSFAVISEGTISEISVAIETSGNYAGVDFGSKAQSPNALSGCAVPSGLSAARVYTSGRKTAARRGSAQEQAVKVTVSFDPDVTPKISIMTMDAARAAGITLAFPCDFNPA